ncbi:uncharacterized protein LTR77_008451 [Saxophila tyrrhenica]|uniref:Uncharacterized protein n=1 Tax=Saxophila tyrrhenica TaxID=1690608 RepID=A0AAV9P1G0_9PEZI|nr:hypothetical protein LTR77_008451 [Saxophila tyrrhenica]
MRLLLLFVAALPLAVIVEKQLQLRANRDMVQYWQAIRAAPTSALLATMATNTTTGFTSMQEHSGPDESDQTAQLEAAASETAPERTAAVTTTITTISSAPSPPPVPGQRPSVPRRAPATLPSQSEQRRSRA